jgi:hypothetical protein
MVQKKLVTRRQLRGYGATPYLARKVTKNLTHLDRLGKAYAYDTRDVITSIRTYLQNPRIKLKTHRTLEEILSLLLTYLDNVVEVTFATKSHTELSSSVKDLIEAMHESDSALANLKAHAASLCLEN